MDLLSEKISSTPQQFASHMKDKGAIFFSAPEQLWIVTDHELAISVLKSSEISADRSSFFMTKMSGCPFHKLANFFSVVKKMMVMSDPPEHTQRKKLASNGISDHVIDHFMPCVKSVVHELVNSLKGRSHVEFVDQIALPLPNTILADLFSIPAENRNDFYRWSNHMTQFFGGGSDDLMRDAENADTGALQLSRYFMKLMGERRNNLKDDFISHLLRGQGELDDSEVISQSAIMLVAGTVTTTDQICNNLYEFLSSGVWQTLVDNRSLLDRAIEEATRLDPAVNFVFRVAKSHMNFAGADIQAGQILFVANHAANRSERIFKDADKFELSREKNPHLSYGSGIHYCIGARLARIQMKELFGQLLEHYPNLSLDSQKSSQRKHQSLAFSGFETLFLQLEKT